VQPFRAGDEVSGAGRPDGAPQGPRRNALRLLVLLVLLVVVALSGCGGDGDPDGAAAPPSASPSEHSVQEPSQDPDGAGEPEPTSAPTSPGAGSPDLGVPSPTFGPPLVVPPTPVLPTPELPTPELPTAEPTTAEPPQRPDLLAFLADCELGVREWRAAQVDYPSELTIEVGGSASYVAAVDTRSTPADPGELIPGPSPTAEAAAVRCEVAARLSPSGEALTVDERDWVLRRFTPTGFIRWSWTVTAVKGGDHDLELELQPAVRTEDGRFLVSDSTLDVSTFITRAHVDEDAIQEVGSWMDSHKGPLAVIAAALAAAIIGVLRFGREFATEMRQTVSAWSGTRAARGGAPAPEDGEQSEDDEDDEDLAPSGHDPP
jgi:hypothetical protein